MTLEPVVVEGGAGARALQANAVNCARLISAYDDCGDRVQAQREAIKSCETNGGVPLPSARDGELVCMVQR